MKWDVIERNWPHYRRVVKLRWTRLDEVSLSACAGKREKIAVLIQEEYGASPGEADEQLAAWLDSQS